MGVTLLVICFLSALAAGQAAGDEDPVDLQSTPAYLIVGKDNGEIWRCDFYNPTRCEVFYKHSKSIKVLFTYVHGQHLYAALGNARLLRCELYRKSPCTIINLFDSSTSCTIINLFDSSTSCTIINLFDSSTSLAVTGGYLYAGLIGRKILRCKLNLLENCETVHDFMDVVRSIYVFDKYLYVATIHFLFYCSNGEEGFHCSQVDVNNQFELRIISHMGNVFIKISYSDNNLWYYNMTSSDSMIYNNKVQPGHPRSGNTQYVAVFRRKIHVLFSSGDIKVSTEYNNTFMDFVQHKRAYSISFAYAVRHMQSKQDVGSCLGAELPMAAFRAEQRWLVEVSVVAGKLVDRRGRAVDTGRAGEGRSGRAGVFAMGPDGQLLLTSEHRSGLAHVPSLFAGGPVAGAGEMQVERGVVKRIVACSVHYWPDVALNRQVVDELYRKGYIGADDIILEECDYKCDKDGADVHSDL